MGLPHTINAFCSGILCTKDMRKITVVFTASNGIFQMQFWPLYILKIKVPRITKTIYYRYSRYLVISKPYFFVFQGENGILELLIKGDNSNEQTAETTAEEVFEISPSLIYNQRTKFVIAVKNNKKLDYENLKTINFEVPSIVYIHF